MEHIEGATYTFRISPGVEGVKETLVLMRYLVRESKRDPGMIELARAHTAMVAGKDWSGEAAALLAFVRNTIRYVQDPTEVETLATPQRLLEIGSGDCDEMSVLLATLLEAIGHRTRFKAIGFAPGELTHVYVQAQIDFRGAEWMSLDATEPFPAGWEPEDYRNFFLIHNK